MAFSVHLSTQHLGGELVLALQTFVGEILSVDDALVLWIGMELGHLGSRPSVLGYIAQYQTKAAQTL